MTKQLPCNRLMNEMPTPSGLVTLWQQDVAPSQRHEYEVHVGKQLVARGDAYGYKTFSDIVKGLCNA